MILIGGLWLRFKKTLVKSVFMDLKALGKLSELNKIILTCIIILTTTYSNVYSLYYTKSKTE